MYTLVMPFFLSLDKGAETSIYLASSPEVQRLTAKYLIKKRAAASSPESYGEGITRCLWEKSAELMGLVA
jgi:hypothetical protein